MRRQRLIRPLLAVFFCLSMSLPQLLYADPLDYWHWRNPLPQGNPLYSIAHGNNTFVAIGSFGTIVTSPDGVTWTIRKEGTITDDWLYDIAYGNNIFVALGGKEVLTSPNGINWTRTPGRRLASHGLSRYLSQIRMGLSTNNP